MSKFGIPKNLGIWEISQIPRQSKIPGI